MTRKLLVVIGLLASAAAVWAYDDGDWQFWAAQQVEHKVSDRLKVRAETEFYFGDDLSELYHRRVEVGLTTPLAKWFELAASYRYFEEKKEGEWRDEHRPHLSGTFLWPLGLLSLADRNRFEYRIREGSDDFWRYRNRLRATAASKWTRFEVQPYADGEVFYDFDAEDWNQARAAVGLSSKWAAHLKTDLYYMLQRCKKDGDWIDTNILGLNLKFPF